MKDLWYFLRARTPGNHLFSSFSLEKMIPSHAGGRGAQMPENHFFDNFSPEKLEKVIPLHAGGEEEPGC